VHQLLGVVYLRKQQPEQALTEAERAIALDPAHAAGYATLAEVLSAVGRAEEAIGVAEKAIRLGFHPHWFLYNLRPCLLREWAL